jgi:hypothetical protein
MNALDTLISPIPALRPYQLEAGRAVLDSVFNRRGLSITIEIARQGGKNELSAQIELFLLTLSATRAAEAVKCAPTYDPQLHISLRRLWLRITQASLLPIAAVEPHAIRVGNARLLFLSAEPESNVVGHTASLLLEVDEAQDVDAEKFDRDFRPMAATTNATTVYYGTAWDDTTLLERAKQANLETERRDGARRHFAYDWQTVARYVPAYGDYVEGERRRLGDTHPIYLTQYCLKPVSGAGRLLSHTQRALLSGTHSRLSQPEAGEVYVAGLDLAGGDNTIDERAGSPEPNTEPPTAPLSTLWRAVAEGRGEARRDSTVLTIGRVVHPGHAAIVHAPRIEIVQHYAWTGTPHETLLPAIIDLLRDVWCVRRATIDATGLGETAARLIAVALGGSRVDQLKFTAASKSELGFELLASINGGRLKLYRGDGSPDYREFQHQAELARVTYRANQTMNFFVDENDGHDDYIVSAALLVRASQGAERRVASGRVRA